MVTTRIHLLKFYSTPITKPYKFYFHCHIAQNIWTVISQKLKKVLKRPGHLEIWFLKNDFWYQSAHFFLIKIWYIRTGLIWHWVHVNIFCLVLKREHFEDILSKIKNNMSDEHVIWRKFTHTSSKSKISCLGLKLKNYWKNSLDFCLETAAAICGVWKEFFAWILVCQFKASLHCISEGLNPFPSEEWLIPIVNPISINRLERPTITECILLGFLTYLWLCFQQKLLG